MGTPSIPSAGCSVARNPLCPPLLSKGGLFSIPENKSLGDGRWAPGGAVAQGRLVALRAGRMGNAGEERVTAECGLGGRGCFQSGVPNSVVSGGRPLKNEARILPCHPQSSNSWGEGLGPGQRLRIVVPEGGAGGAGHRSFRVLAGGSRDVPWAVRAIFPG